jgi:hypothetical protein
MASLTAHLERQRNAQQQQNGGAAQSLFDDDVQFTEQQQKEMVDPNFRMTILRRALEPEALREHLLYLQSLIDRPDYSKILKQMFGKRDVTKMVMRISSELDQSRRCRFCNVAFCKRDSITRYDCRMHTRPFRGGRYDCCGSTSHRSAGCTPCIHMCDRSDVSPFTGQPAYTMVRMPLIMLISGHVRWPDPHDVEQVEYVRNEEDDVDGGVVDPLRAFLVYPIHRHRPHQDEEAAEEETRRLVSSTQHHRHLFL